MEIKTNVITDKKTGTTTSATVSYDFGESLEDLTALCDKKIIRDHAVRQMVTSLRSKVKQLLLAGKDIDEIQEVINSWRPGDVVVRTKKDPMAAAAAIFETLSEEDQLSYLRKLGANV